MYKEFTLCFPRYDLLDIESNSINLFRQLLNVLEITINLNWLSQQIDECITGEGNIYVFHNSKDIDCFLLIDCFCGYTDQLNTALIQVRVCEEKSLEIKEIMEELRLTYWDNSDCLVMENCNDEIKIKSVNYDNFAIENARKKIISWRKYLESQNTDRLTFISIEEEQPKEFKVHQPIFHYLNGEIIEP